MCIRDSAERVIGGSRTYILLKHVVRNTAAPVLVFATVMVADAIAVSYTHLDVYKRQFSNEMFG